MPNWKKLLTSGSSGSLSNLVVDNHISASVISGSFYGDGSGLTGVTATGTLSSSAQIADNISGSFTSTSASIAVDIAGNFNSFADLQQEVQTILNSTGSKYSQINNLMAATGSVYSHVSGILSETGSQYSHISNLNSFTGSFSSSAASRITDLESFSASLDATFATEAELNTATASLSASLAIDIVANENNIGDLQGSVGSINFFTGSFSGSATTRITSLEEFSSSLNNTFATDVELNTATASLSASLASDIINITTTSNSFTGSFTGSFYGDGSGLTGVTTTITEESTVTDTFTNVTTASVSHLFGTKNVLVTVYDSNDDQFVPSRIHTPDTNTVEIYMDPATTGRVVVAKGGHLVSGSVYKELITGVTSSVINHNLQEEFPIVQLYESASKEQFIPSTIKSVDIDNIQVVLSELIDCYVVIKR